MASTDSKPSSGLTGIVTGTASTPLRTIAEEYAVPGWVATLPARDLVPPVEGIRVFLTEHPEFVIEGDQLGSTLHLEYHELSAARASAVIVVLNMSEHQAMDWQSLADACFVRPQ